MSLFVASVFLLLITPGPGVLSTAGVGSGFGKQAGLSYLTGLFIGTNLVALAVITGLAALLFSISGIRTLLLVCSTAYLLWLALRIALSGSKIEFINSKKAPSLRDGILLQIINPKAYIVNTTLFSGYAFGYNNLLLETSVKLLVINIFWIPIHILWLFAGINLKRLAPNPAIQRVINMLMAVSMVGVVILALYSQK